MSCTTIRVLYRRNAVRALGSVLNSRKPRVAAAILLIGATCGAAPRLATATMFVTSRNDSRLVEFDEVSGTLVASLNVPSGPDGVTVYNGNVYVSSKSHSSSAHDASTLSPLFLFYSGAVSSEEAIEVGPDGLLYMADFNSNRIARFQPAGGAYLGTFASIPFASNTGLTFGPDGDIYATSQESPSVFRVSSSGSYMGLFTSGVSLLSADGLTFGPDGNLYVSNRGANRVERFDGTTGAFTGTFASVADPHGLGFGPDGHLYVVSGPQIARIDGVTGAVLSTFGSGLLSDPQNLAFVPEIVPEPSSLTLAGIGMAGAFFGWRRRKAR